MDSLFFQALTHTPELQIGPIWRLRDGRICNIFFSTVYNGEPCSGDIDLLDGFIHMSSNDCVLHRKHRISVEGLREINQYFNPSSTV